MTTRDVVIVGAGAAGLGAGRAAQAAGLSFEIVEALDRSGGRAWTDTATYGVPIDLGCHWLHSASVNPFRGLADRYGLTYRQSGAPRRLYDGPGLIDTALAEAIEASTERSFEAFLAAGERGVDASLTELIDSSEPGFDLFRMWMQAEWSVAAENVSSLDASRYHDTDENWPMIDGYGALVQRHAEGIPVSLGTRVTAIDWSGHPIRVETSAGLIETASVVMTISTAVLAQERIAFTPSLPNWKIEAAAAVPLGTANKVYFGLDPATAAIGEPFNASVPFSAGGMTSLQVLPYERDMISFYLAGPVAAELERAGTDAMEDACRETVVSVFGSKMGAALHTPRSVTWGRIETIGGAYASALPGHAEARLRLGEPVENRLFFAGEATHPSFFSTCHGAHLSGIRAIEEVVETRSRD